MPAPRKAVIDGQKQCSECLQFKPLDDFHKRIGRASGQSNCKVCKNAQRLRYDRAYNAATQAAYQARKVAEDPNFVRRSNIQRVHGITLERFEEMLAAQGGVCAVCAGPPMGQGNQYHVDHDHVTGVIRGLLCSNCNTALGFVCDSQDRLRALIAYLDRSAT